MLGTELLEFIEFCLGDGFELEYHSSVDSQYKVSQEIELIQLIEFIWKVVFKWQAAWC